MILLSTAYCPPIIYMAQFIREEEILIEKEETYLKQTWRNRCSIYTDKGKLDLSIPVAKPFGNKTKTRDIQIYNFYKWNLEHWRAIQSAYNKSPFFLFYKDELEDLFQHPLNQLIEQNNRMLQLLVKLAGLPATFTYTDDFIKHPVNATDLRYILSPKRGLDLEMPPYPQVFSEKAGFIPNLSFLDLLFNKGPESSAYLREIAKMNHLA